MAKQKEASATQQFIEIDSIENGIVKLKGGGLRKILLVSGTNFELKSDEEQGLITYAFQGFLNSLDFSLQILIHSRKMNIDDYLSMLEEREGQEVNELLKNQIFEYREFIKTFVSQNAIMSKTFFVVVPYESASVSQASSAITDKIFGVFGQKPKTNPTAGLEEAKLQLEQRTEEVVGGLNQIGLRAIPLNDEELTELFYNLYNPESVEKRGVEIGNTYNK